MSYKAKVTLISLFTLLLTFGAYQGWQMTSHAAIGNSQAWSSIYAGTAFPAAAGYTYAVNAGSDRLLVVAVQSTVTAAATQTCTVTWGGKTLTQATGDGTTSRQAHTYLYYLKESDIAAATGTTLIATVTGGTTSYNMVRAAVYTGVDQTAPVKMVGQWTSTTTAGTAVGPLSPTLTIAAGEQAVAIVNLSRTGSTTSRTITPAAPWTSLLTTATGAGTGTIGVRNYILGDTTAATGVTCSYTASGTTLSSIAAMVISPKTSSTLTVSGNTTIAPTGTRLDTDTGVLMQRVQVTGSGTMEINSLTLDDLGTASVLASAEIYISPTSATTLPVDAVLVASATNWAGTSTQFSLTGGTTANRTLGGTEPLTKYVYIVYDMSSGQAKKTVRSSITAVGVVSPNVGATGLSLSSNILTLDYSGNMLSTSANTTGAANAKDSDAAVVMQHFKVDCNTAFDNALELNSLTLQELGTTAQVSTVKIYVSATEDADATKLPSNAMLVGQITDWNKTSISIPLINDYGATAADRTVLAGTSKYLYVVYSMFYPDDADYVAGKTVQSNVTAVGAASPDTGLTGLNYLSNSIILTRGTWSRITSCGGCHDTANIYDEDGRNSKTLFNREGRFPGSHYAHSNKLAYDCSTCHYKPSVYNHASGFINFSGAIRGDKYSRSSGNKVAVSNSTYQFGTCNNISCHGVQSPAWAADFTGVAQCDKCHSGPAYTAPFMATSRSTSSSDSHTGAHDGHMQTGKGYADPVSSCTACHQTVSTITSTGHMDGAATFNTANVTSYNPATGSCTSTCHKGTSVVWNNTAYLTGTPSATECAKCHAAPPATSTHTGLTVSGSDFSVCVACHQNLNTNGTFKNKSLHMNGIVNVDASSGGFACTACHTTLAAMTSDTTTYHHVLASTAADYAGNTCLKCHADHNIFQVAQNSANNVGVSANLRVDNAITPTTGGAPGTTYTNTDFVSTATNGGICTSCHMNAIAKNTTNQKYSADINNTTMVVTKAQFTGSMHNYTTSSTYTKDSSKFLANCVKCHNDTLAETKQAGSKTFGLHLSATRELFSPLGATTGQDAREGYLCFGCHSTKGQQIDNQTQKPTAGKDWYGSRTMKASAEDTFTSFSTATRVFRHNTGKYSAKHKVTEDQTYISANKHVECADCHNSHAATYGNHTQGSATLANALAGATGVVPSYAGSGSAGLPGVTGTTLYFKNTTPGTPTAKQNSSTPINVTAFTSRDMSTGTGATASTQAITIPTATVASTYFMGTAFVSPAMTAGTIPAQTYTVNVAVNASSSTSPNRARLVAYAYKWNGTTATLIASPVTNTGAYLPTTKATQTITLSSATATTVAAGDRLVIEVYVVTGTSATTAAMTATLYYGSATDTSNVAMTTGGVWNTASSYTPGAATQEYQICFKCHTPANTSYASWGGTAAAAWTDLAMEFNPNNSSRHPIGTPLAVGSQLTAAKLAGGWTPGQVMNCTDCHATDSTASKGPHGSAVKWMLAGTNKAWPYNAASANGKSTGTLFLVNTYNSGVGTVNGLFCLNCHTVTASNTFHASGDVTGGQHGSSAVVAACVACHIRVPHGGKVSRLRLTTNAPTRYRADGNATAPAYGGWAVQGSAVSSSTIKTNTCGQHSGASATEAW